MHDVTYIITSFKHFKQSGLGEQDSHEVYARKSSWLSSHLIQLCSYRECVSLAGPEEC